MFNIGKKTAVAVALTATMAGTNISTAKAGEQERRVQQGQEYSTAFKLTEREKAEERAAKKWAEKEFAPLKESLLKSYANGGEFDKLVHNLNEGIETAKEPLVGLLDRARGAIKELKKSYDDLKEYADNDELDAEGVVQVYKNISQHNLLDEILARASQEGGFFRLNKAQASNKEKLKKWLSNAVEWVKEQEQEFASSEFIDLLGYVYPDGIEEDKPTPLGIKRDIRIAQEGLHDSTIELLQNVEKKFGCSELKNECAMNQ